jgi:hypothetical protein
VADPYQVLGISRDATPDEIRRAYKAEARKWHPDRNPDPQAAERFREVAAAWAVLGDAGKRRAHDRRSVGATDLDEAWLDAVAAAIERAQDYAERVVVPHYASRFRGLGAEMGGEALRDLRKLGDPQWLQARATWRGRRRARGWLARITVTWGGDPYDVTQLIQTRDGFVIRVSPVALSRGGAVDVDDIVLRLVVARYAQILAIRRFRPPPGEQDADWDVALAVARRTDDVEVRRWRTNAAIWTAVGAVVAFLLYAGFTGL